MNRKTFGSRSCHERCKIIKVIVIMQMLWFEYTFISSSNFVSSCFKRIIMLWAFPIKESCLTRIQFTVHWINIEKKTLIVCIFMACSYWSCKCFSLFCVSQFIEELFFSCQAPEFKTVQLEVSRILKEKILVGHSLKNDLEVSLVLDYSLVVALTLYT